jgi:putative Ca2+/H+ antiporter (TMEM165/GDT1 family)
VTALWATFGLVVVAELGDKSMLMAMFLAPRYGAVRVMVVLSIEAALIMALAVLAGGAVELLLSEQQLAILSGLLFIGCGIWALRDDDERSLPAVDRVCSSCLRSPRHSLHRSLATRRRSPLSRYRARIHPIASASGSVPRWA